MFTILPPAEKRCKGTEKSAYMQTKIVESLFYFRYLIAINYGRYTVKNIIVILAKGISKSSS